MNWFMVLAVIFVIGVCVIAGVSESKKAKQYMQKQLETSEDKRALLDLMSKILGEAFVNYTILVGYYTKVTHRGNTTTYYYFPYALAFTQDDLIIYPIIKKEGQLYYRNQMAVDWSATELKQKKRKDGVTLTFKIVGETMPIHIDPVIKSNGMEKSDRPLGIYQEQEYQRFMQYLPGYLAKAKNANE